MKRVKPLLWLLMIPISPPMLERCLTCKTVNFLRIMLYQKSFSGQTVQKGLKRMIKAYFRLALKGIRQRKLRSWLTILGVALGIVLIISLLSLGEGLKTTVLRQLQMLGTDTIFIFPGEEANPFFSLAGLELSVEDVEVV